MELEGKVAAVTGGTRGIGRAIAEAFVREGAKVVISGRSEEKGQQALKEMDAGDAVVFVAGDAKQREDCERVVDTAVEKFGRIDIMVNNAGGASNHAAVVDLTDEALDDALRWNLWSTFWCTRRSLQHMIPQKWGRIINISSVEGKCGKPGVSIYVTAKHAVNGLTKACAHEVGTLGITVNALCPGAIETDIMAEEGAQGRRVDGHDLPATARLVRRGVGDEAPVRGGGRRRGRRAAGFRRRCRHHRRADLDRRRHVAVLSRRDSDMGKLDGKVAAITGGTRSIGRGIADAFVREGAIRRRQRARRGEGRGSAWTRWQRATAPPSSPAT